MPVLDKSAGLIDDPWVFVADADPLPQGRPAIVGLARLLAEPALLDHAWGLGVSLKSADRLEPISGMLDRLPLVALEFPIFRDGRGFTLARTLREHFDYGGDIRAFGHLLPDQYVALLRCGVSTVALPETTQPGRWAEALALRGTQAGPFLRRVAKHREA